MFSIIKASSKTTMPPTSLLAPAYVRVLLERTEKTVEERPKVPLRIKTIKKEARREQKRTALRELWSGLTDWAGMGDDDEW